MRRDARRGALVGGAAALAAGALAWALAPGAPGAAPPIDPDDPAQVALGERVYRQACAACHGADLEGAPDWRSRGPDGRLPAPPHDETGHTWHHADRALIDYVTLGGAEALARAGVEGFESGMPGFGDVLTEAEIRAVLAYIKASWPEDIQAAQRARDAGATVSGSMTGFRERRGRMNRREILAAAAAAAAAAGLAALGAPALAAAPQVHVMKSPYCGCCGGWVDHMRAEGFEVEVVDLSPEALDAAKATSGVTPDTASCHTAHVEGYVIEGHVPAEDVRRLLAEKPEALGLAAPGMPMGSPGMDAPGMEAEPYEVLLLKRGGGTEVFARH